MRKMPQLTGGRRRGEREREHSEWVGSRKRGEGRKMMGGRGVKTARVAS
jgi:hypothetical protein